jgi:hypothetical protein
MKNLNRTPVRMRKRFTKTAKRFAHVALTVLIAVLRRFEVATNTRQPIIVNGVTYSSRGKAEVDLRLSTGTLCKKLKMLKLPVVIDIKGKRYQISRPEAGPAELTDAARIQKLEAVILDTFWMARRYANGRHTAATSTVNDALATLGEIGMIIRGDNTLVDDGNSSPFVLDDI